MNNVVVNHFFVPIFLSVYSLLDLRLYDLVLLGAAVLVVLRPAAEDVRALVGGRAVEPVVPLPDHVHVTGAELAPEDWKWGGGGAEGGRRVMKVLYNVTFVTVVVIALICFHCCCCCSRCCCRHHRSPC